MILYEIDKSDIRKYGTKKAIENGFYVIRDDEFVRCAFNFGNGTKKHMNEYMKNNSCFCVWINAVTMQRVNKI